MVAEDGVGGDFRVSQGAEELGDFVAVVERFGCVFVAVCERVGSEVAGDADERRPQLKESRDGPREGVGVTQRQADLRIGDEADPLPFPRGGQPRNLHLLFLHNDEPRLDHHAPKEQQQPGRETRAEEPEEPCHCAVRFN
ncbi:hypothetical protein BH20VER1_BH20VER1_13320 [soil metagenome]